MTIVSVIACVYGVVQSVGFRYHTQYHARQLGVNGYVRNCDDGSVEIVACGQSQAVERLLEWLRAGGPRSARVDTVLAEPHGKMDYQGFSVRY